MSFLQVRAYYPVEVSRAVFFPLEREVYLANQVTTHRSVMMFLESNCPLNTLDSGGTNRWMGTKLLVPDPFPACITYVFHTFSVVCYGGQTQTLRWKFLEDPTSNVIPPGVLPFFEGFDMASVLSGRPSDIGIVSRILDPVRDFLVSPKFVGVRWRQIPEEVNCSCLSIRNIAISVYVGEPVARRYCFNRPLTCPSCTVFSSV